MFLVLIPGWLLFRARDLSHAVALAERVLFGGFDLPFLPSSLFLHVIILQVAVWFAPGFQAILKRSQQFCISRKSLARVWVVASGVTLGFALFLCVVFLRGVNSFIYFDF